MQIPLYFLNDNEVKDLKYIIDIYRYISKNPVDLIGYNEEISILSKLKKRVYLDNSELIPLIVLSTVTIAGSEIVNCGFDLNILESKKLLLKLISTHKTKIKDEDYINNIKLFNCIYKTLKNSMDKLSLNKYEMDTYSYLELLYI